MNQSKNTKNRNLDWKDSRDVWNMPYIPIFSIQFFWISDIWIVWQAQALWWPVLMQVGMFELKWSFSSVWWGKKNSPQYFLGGLPGNFFRCFLWFWPILAKKVIPKKVWFYHREWRALNNPHMHHNFWHPSKRVNYISYLFWKYFYFEHFQLKDDLLRFRWFLMSILKHVIGQLLSIVSSKIAYKIISFSHTEGKMTQHSSLSVGKRSYSSESFNRAQEICNIYR